MGSEMVIDRMMAVAAADEDGRRTRNRGGRRKSKAGCGVEVESQNPHPSAALRAGPNVAKNGTLGLGTQPERERARHVKLSRKQRGEMAEGAFLAKVSGMGFAVAKPWGESSRYDLVVDVGGKLVRVQVKSAHRAGEYGGYCFHAHGNTKRVYRASEIDVLVAYVVPEDAWYVFPVTVFRNYKSMKLFPGSRRRGSKFEKYREAWWVMNG